MAGDAREVGVAELAHLPFVRHQVDPALVEGAWTSGAASVVLAHRPLPQGRVLVAHGFGDAADLGPLLSRLAAGPEATAVRPDRVLVDADRTVIPSAWPLTELREWHWMLSTTAPPADTLPVERIADEAEVGALLDAEAPDSLARPGTPGIEAWHGLREDGVLVAVGAVLRQPDGTGHLRAITVARRRRGHGLGRALSTALTRLARAGTGVSSLGVYTDNEPALRIYRDLGYEVVHTFRSGPVSRRSRTSAAAPSR